MCAQEAAERGGKERGSEVRRGGQPHKATQATRRAVQAPQQAVDLALHPLRGGQHLLAERGGYEALQAALKELATKFALEAIQAPRDSAGVDPESLPAAEKVRPRCRARTIRS